MNFSNATDSTVGSVVNARAHLLDAAVDVLDRAARLQLLGVALQALLHLGHRPDVFLERRPERLGHLVREPAQRASRPFQLGDALRREVLRVGLLLHEVGALDALLDLIGVLEHADVGVGAHQAGPERAHVGLVALGEPAARVEHLLGRFFFLRFVITK